MRTQMTARKAGALIDDVKGRQSVVWKTVQRNVLRLQMRIAKAVSEGKPGKVKALQWLLTHSYHARLMAVRRVTSNLDMGRCVQPGHSTKVIFEMPEPCEGKLSRTVLRGEGG